MMPAKTKAKREKLQSNFALDLAEDVKQNFVKQ